MKSIISVHAKIVAILICILGSIVSLLPIIIPLVRFRIFIPLNLILVVLLGIGTYIATVVFFGFAKLLENSDISVSK